MSPPSNESSPSVLDTSNKAYHFPYDHRYDPRSSSNSPSSNSHHLVVKLPATTLNHVIPHSKTSNGSNNTASPSSIFGVSSSSTRKIFPTSSPSSSTIPPSSSSKNTQKRNQNWNGLNTTKKSSQGENSTIQMTNKQSSVCIHPTKENPNNDNALTSTTTKNTHLSLQSTPKINISKLRLNQHLLFEKPNDGSKFNTIPSWAGTTTNGEVLHVIKNGETIETICLDDKCFCIFGRNPKLCLDGLDEVSKAIGGIYEMKHPSSSRVHALFIHNKESGVCYIVDLGSQHGTFVSNTRLEPYTPFALRDRLVITFGCSSRKYILRVFPKNLKIENSNSIDIEDRMENGERRVMTHEEEQVKLHTNMNCMLSYQSSENFFKEREERERSQSLPIPVDYYDRRVSFSSSQPEIIVPGNLRRSSSGVPYSHTPRAQQHNNNTLDLNSINQQYKFNQLTDAQKNSLDIFDFKSSSGLTVVDEYYDDSDAMEEEEGSPGVYRERKRSKCEVDFNMDDDL